MYIPCTRGSSMVLEEDEHENEIHKDSQVVEGQSYIDSITNNITRGSHSCTDEPTDQQSLHPLHSADLCTFGDTKGRYGISMHGFYYQGPRPPPTTLGEHPEIELKVIGSTKNAIQLTAATGAHPLTRGPCSTCTDHMESHLGT